MELETWTCALLVVFCAIFIHHNKADLDERCADGSGENCRSPDDAGVMGMYIQEYMCTVQC